MKTFFVCFRVLNTFDLVKGGNFGHFGKGGAKIFGYVAKGGGFEFFILLENKGN